MDQKEKIRDITVLRTLYLQAQKKVYLSPAPGPSSVRDLGSPRGHPAFLLLRHLQSTYSIGTQGTTHLVKAAYGQDYVLVCDLLVLSERKKKEKKRKKEEEKKTRTRQVRVRALPVSVC